MAVKTERERFIQYWLINNTHQLQHRPLCILFSHSTHDTYFAVKKAAMIQWLRIQVLAEFTRVVSGIRKRVLPKIAAVHEKWPA